MLLSDVPKPNLFTRFDNRSSDDLCFRVPERTDGSYPRSGILVFEDTSPFAALIDSIGRASFYKTLIDILIQVCKVDHLGVYSIKTNGVKPVGAISFDGSDIAKQRVDIYSEKGYWRDDPSMDKIRQSLVSRNFSLIKVNVQKLSEQVRRALYHDVVDKVVFAGVYKDECFCVTLVRTGNRESFSHAELHYLLALGGPIISAVAKHFEVSEVTPSRALSALPDIEKTIISEGILTQREAQVCARILYGMCVAGIALDLEIGEETIKTYRSRAYSRLNIGSQRELLMWYLSIWNAFDA